MREEATGRQTATVGPRVGLLGRGTGEGEGRERNAQLMPGTVEEVRQQCSGESFRKYPQY